MSRSQWADLPEPVRHAVEARFGAVAEVRSAGSGYTSGAAACLDTGAGTIFLKALPESDVAANDFVLEGQVNEVLPISIPAPRMLWRAGEAGWLMMAFEYVPGRPADLSPDSPDVPVVLAALAQVTTELTPCPWLQAPTMAQEVRRWQAKCTAILEDVRTELEACVEIAHTLDLGALEGDTLLHADLHSMNILIEDGAHFLDWGPGLSRCYVDRGGAVRLAVGWERS